MAWDPTPWFVGGGAQHSPEVARLLAFAATSGAEGIVTGTDLKVQPLAVPGGSVRVAPGAALIRNRSTGGAQQSYVARMATEDTVAIAPTGSGTSRSDLIVAQIEDPFMAGEPWADPADPTVGPYVFTRVLSNVPANARTLADAGYTGRSAVPLARIDLPASTGTVTDAHITDLRKVAHPRRHREVEVVFPAVDDNIPTTVYSRWPRASNIQVPVPEWATVLKVVIHLAGVELIGSGTTVAGLRTYFGDGTPQASYSSQNTIAIADAAGRAHYIIAGTHNVSGLQGTTQHLMAQGLRSAGTGTFQADYQTTIVIDYEFEEAPV